MINYASLSIGFSANVPFTKQSPLNAVYQNFTSAYRTKDVLAVNKLVSHKYYLNSLSKHLNNISSNDGAKITHRPAYLQGNNILSRAARPRRNLVKRTAIPDPRHVRTDRQYLLAVYLNKNAAAGIDLNILDDAQLALRLMESLDKKKVQLPEFARLALSGSRLFGERRGETLSPLQQRSLVGQLLCQLIYKEESIALRIAKLFDENRRVTHKQFTAVVQSWPYAHSHETDIKRWRETYEAPEIPTLYFDTLYYANNSNNALSDPQWLNDNQTAVIVLDNLWVGSLTWTLMHFGARSIALDDPAKLTLKTPFSMVELGLGIVSLFRQGELAIGVETMLHLGLLVYYLRVRPDLPLADILTHGSLDPAFDLLKAEHGG